jgi:hypothetical protein
MYNFLKKSNRLENFLIFIICALLHVLNLLIFSNISNSTLHYLFSCYFDDLLAPLLLFSYINILLSFYNKKIYSLKYLITFILLVSIVWEYLIGFIKPNSVSDPLDILAYILGTLIYWMIHKKTNEVKFERTCPFQRT